MFIFNTIVYGIPISCAGITTCWAIKKYMESKTSECSREGAEVEGSEPNEKSEPAAEMEKNQDLSYTGKEEPTPVQEDLDESSYFPPSVARSNRTPMKLGCNNKDLPMKENEGIRSKLWENVDFVCKKAASIYNSARSFLETVASWRPQIFICLVTANLLVYFIYFRLIGYRLTRGYWGIYLITIDLLLADILF
jgi:hypothetical protein